jgi:HSF-type DNA-binding
MCTSKNGAGGFHTNRVDKLAKSTGEFPFYEFSTDALHQTAECDSSCGEDQQSTNSSHGSTQESPPVAESVKPSSSPRCTRTTRKNGGQKTRIRHLITQHDYHDHAADPVAYNTMESTASLLASSKPRRDSITSSPTNNSTSSTTPFPLKLYEMIEQMECDGLSHVMSWQPHGRCFQVHEPKAFKQMLQNYFKLSKIASFQRQLNLYGFQRLTAGLDKGSYYHELFLRNRRDLVAQIQRVKVKGTGVRAKANPQDEPNLYMYPPVDALAITAVACDVVPSTSVLMEDLKPRSVPSLNSVAEIRSLEQMDDGMMMDENEPCFAEAPEYYETSSRCEIMRGLARNLSSMNVLTFDDEMSNSSSFNTLWKTVSYQTPGLLRNVSSSLFDVSRPSAPHIDDLDNERNQMECIPEDNFSSREATAAVDAYLLATEGNDQVSFDKLIDEMFNHNQDIDFSELVKLATEV